MARGRGGGISVHVGGDSGVSVDPANFNRALIGLNALGLLYALYHANKVKSFRSLWPILLAFCAGLIYTIIVEIVSDLSSSLSVPITAVNCNLPIVFLLATWIVVFRVLLSVSEGDRSRHGCILAFGWMFVIFLLGEVQNGIIYVFGFSTYIVSAIILYSSWLLVALFLGLTYYHYKRIEKLMTFVAYGLLLSIQVLAGTVIANVVYSTNSDVVMTMTVLNFVFNNLLIIIGLYIAIPMVEKWTLQPKPLPDVPRAEGLPEPEHEKTDAAHNA